jgi:hypothetical protein
MKEYSDEQKSNLSSYCISFVKFHGACTDYQNNFKGFNGFHSINL